MKEWITKIRSVPEFYIREVIASAESVGLPSNDAGFCAGFLLSRRGKLESLIESNISTFTQLQPTIFDTKKSCGAEDSHGEEIRK